MAVFSKSSDVLPDRLKFFVGQKRKMLDIKNKVFLCVITGLLVIVFNKQ